MRNIEKSTQSQHTDQSKSKSKHGTRHPIPIGFRTFLLPSRDFLFFFRHVVIAIGFDGVRRFVFSRHGLGERRETCLDKFGLTWDMATQTLGHQIGFMDFGRGIPIAVFPFIMEGIDEIKHPDKVRCRGSAPNGYGVVQMSLFVKQRIDLVIGIKHPFRGAKHLHGFQEYFADMFVHHILGNFLLQQRENEKIHV